MRAVVLQPMYLPWMGYFGMIEQADVFVFYDDVQFSRDSWQQRNRIKVPVESGETKWLKVPVINDFGQEVKEVQVDTSRNWRENHWSALVNAYGDEPIPYGPETAGYFEKYREQFKKMYKYDWTSLLELNVTFILGLVELINVSRPEFLFSSDIGVGGSGTERLIELLTEIGATEYVSGPGAKEYLEVERFVDAGIDLYWHEFDHPEYNQLYDGFVSHLSAVDVLFNMGDETKRLIQQGEADALISAL